MKAFLAVFALTGTLLGTSAALAIDPRPGRNAEPELFEEYDVRHPGPQAGRSAFATSSQRGTTTAKRRSANPAYDVYYNGHYVGSDPDPFVRNMLYWDNWTNQ